MASTRPRCGLPRSWLHRYMMFRCCHRRGAVPWRKGVLGRRTECRVTPACMAGVDGVGGCLWIWRERLCTSGTESRSTLHSLVHVVSCAAKAHLPPWSGSAGGSPQPLRCPRMHAPCCWHKDHPVWLQGASAQSPWKAAGVSARRVGMGCTSALAVCLAATLPATAQPS